MGRMGVGSSRPCPITDGMMLSSIETSVLLPVILGHNIDSKSEEQWRALQPLGISVPLQHGHKLEVKEEPTPISRRVSASST